MLLNNTEGAHDLDKLCKYGLTIRQSEESGAHAPHLVLTLEQTNKQILLSKWELQF
jgi:hypothetical protein